MNNTFKDFSFVIPLAPITKKNSQQIITRKKTEYEYVNGKFVPTEKNKVLPLPSKQFLAYQENAGWYLQHKGAKISTPINIKCLFYGAWKRKPDLTNLEEAIDDVLVYYGVIEDDNIDIIVSHDGSRAYYDKENPRTELYFSATPSFDTCKTCCNDHEPCTDCEKRIECAADCIKKMIWLRKIEHIGFCPDCGIKF